MNEPRLLAVRAVFAAVVLAGLGCISLGCVPQEFGVGVPCVQDSECFTNKCVALSCAADNASADVPFPTVPVSDASPDAASPQDASND